MKSILEDYYNNIPLHVVSKNHKLTIPTIIGIVYADITKDKGAIYIPKSIREASPPII